MEEIMTITEKPLVLVVDDYKDVADEYAWMIANSGKYEAISAYSAEEALQSLQNNVVRCILLDLKLPDKDGLRLVKKIREQYDQKQVGIIFMTAYFKEAWDEQEIKELALAFFEKPLDERKLIDTLDHFFQKNKG